MCRGNQQVNTSPELRPGWLLPPPLLLLLLLLLLLVLLPHYTRTALLLPHSCLTKLVKMMLQVVK